jgi:hypothetical protein
LARYGSYTDIATFKKFVSTAHSRFGYNIWVTELGVTSASKASQQQTKDFMMNAFSWMDSTGFVDRASWFGTSLFHTPHAVPQQPKPLLSRVLRVEQAPGCIRHR